MEKRYHHRCTVRLKFEMKYYSRQWPLANTGQISFRSDCIKCSAITTVMCHIAIIHYAIHTHNGALTLL